MRVYIAGPMTGLPDHNTPAFDRVELALCESGYEVVSPAAMLRIFPDDSLRQHFSRDCQAICESDCVVLLDGWEHSKGVAVEIALARYLGVPVVEISQFAKQGTVPNSPRVRQEVGHE